MHDSTKLKNAMNNWLKDRCEVGFGQVYSAALLTDFENWCRETGALKASPGIVAFGRELTALGFGCKRVAGLQYRTGLELKQMPENVVERRTAKSKKTFEKSEEKRQRKAKAIKRKINRKMSKIKDDDGVVARMKAESKDRNIAAGEVEPTG